MFARAMQMLLVLAISTFAATLCAVVFNGAGSPIPDNWVTNSGIQVSGAPARMSSIRVGLDITHTYNADIQAVLLPPTIAWHIDLAWQNVEDARKGGAIVLVRNKGGSSDNFNGCSFTGELDPVFDAAGTAAPLSGTGPFTGTWLAEDAQALRRLYGTNPNGEWILLVFDDAMGDIGTLNGWTLEFADLNGPELDMRRGHDVVRNGGTIDSGNVHPGWQHIEQVKVANLGTADLMLAAPATVSAAVNCQAVIRLTPPSTIAPGATWDLLVAITPTAPGPFSCQVGVQSNDGDEATTSFQLSGSAPAPTQHLRVYLHDQEVLPTYVMPVHGAGVGAEATAFVYFRNMGVEEMIVADVKITPLLNCTAQITSGLFNPYLNSTIGMVGAAMIPAAAGSFSAKVEIITNDPRPEYANFSFTYAGVAALAPEPHAVVLDWRSSVVVANGGVAAAHPPIIGSRIIQGREQGAWLELWNLGNAPLTITGELVSTGGSNCAVDIKNQQLLGTVISPGHYQSFYLYFTPGVPGTFTAGAKFETDDPVNPVFTFAVSGVAVPTAALPYFSTPGYSYGEGVYTVDVPVASSDKATEQYGWVQNNGHVLLTVQNMAFLPESLVNCNAEVTEPLSTIAPGKNAKYFVKITPRSKGPFSAVLRIDSDGAVNNPMLVVYSGHATSEGGSGGGGGDGGCFSASGTRVPSAILSLLALAMITARGVLHRK